MAGPRDQRVSADFPGDESAGGARPPAVAGLFYPDDPGECGAMAQSYLRAADHSATGVGGVVPHAGWVCSAALAGQTIAALARAVPEPDVVVVFGAIHTPLPADTGVLDSHGRWAAPGIEVAVATEVQAKLAEGPGRFVVDDRFHRREHAIEVEVPLIRLAWPGAMIVPVEVPVTEDAPALGRRVAQVVAGAKLRAVYLASSDLTHYGPNYGFVPAGVGLSALAWAKDNDRRLLDTIVAGDAEAVVPEVRAHQNACGGGAIAAMLAACRELGRTRGRVLRHASSYETLADVAPQRPDNAVGYAAVVME